jgi:four helix bundle protein
MSRTYRELLVWRKAKDLVVWRKAKDLATLVYRETEIFPKPERFGLTSQIRRAAVSVASNIAEGQGHLTKREFRQFLGQARCSILELETQLAIACELGYLPEAKYQSVDTHSFQVLGLLNRLIESLSVRSGETLKPSKH